MASDKPACIYIIEFSQEVGSPKHRAKFYLGSTVDLSTRLRQHERGKSSDGSPLVHAALQQGEAFIRLLIEFSSEAEARAIELRLKRRKDHREVLRRIERYTTAPSTTRSPFDPHVPTKIQFNPGIELTRQLSKQTENNEL